MKHCRIPLLAAALVGVVLFELPTLAQQNPAGLAIASTAKVVDRFTPFPSGDVKLAGGMLGERIDVNERRRMLTVDENDLLDAFERRNVPHQDWQGEHVGKFLHAATLAWAYSHDPALKAKIDRVVARLLKTQEADGYLGTYTDNKRWTSWDVWVHKYDIIGLLTYYQFTGDMNALEACRRIGDLLVRTFGTGIRQRDINRAGEHMGMAADSVLEPIVLLYRATNDDRYLHFAEYIVSNYDAKNGPAILASLEKYHAVNRVANGKAYEMTSNFNGLLELYRVTGRKRLLDDMEIAWNDIVQNRLYITGGASSFETYQADFHLPNRERDNICETCVTVTWEQMNLELLRLTGDARYADQAERLIYNHLFAAQQPDGEDWAYYTPLDGHKPYDHATTCCHSSGPRGIALIPSIAYMTSDNGVEQGIVVNLYNSGVATAHLKSGDVMLTQQTRYPLDGAVRIVVAPRNGRPRFQLALRVPAWATSVSAKVNGKAQNQTFAVGKPGYLTIDRSWRRGDTVSLDLGVATRLVIGDHENSGKAAIQYGPLVLALDAAKNAGLTVPARAELAAASQSALKIDVSEGRGGSGPRFVTAGRINGQSESLELTPYADAGGNRTSRFEVWMALPGQSAVLGGKSSLFLAGREDYSRAGNRPGAIADGDSDSFRVTYDGADAAEDWYSVTLPNPVLINRAVYVHGKSFHDGGWFDASAGQPRIQVKTTANGEWRTVATLDDYPLTTSTNDAGLTDGSKFEARFPSVSAVAIRIVGKPSCGDNSAQAFSSCAEIQAFYDK